MSLIFFLMSLGSMSHVSLKKCPCRRVEFRGRGPSSCLPLPRTSSAPSPHPPPHPRPAVRVAPGSYVNTAPHLANSNQAARLFGVPRLLDLPLHWAAMSLYCFKANAGQSGAAGAAPGPRRKDQLMVGWVEPYLLLVTWFVWKVSDTSWTLETLSYHSTIGHHYMAWSTAIKHHKPKCPFPVLPEHA